MADVSKISEQTKIDMAYNSKIPWLIGATRASGLNELKAAAREENAALEKFSQDLDTSIQEQNEYIIEIENMQNEFEALEKSYSKKIESSEDKYLELKNKELNGIITEEEKSELADIETEMNGYKSEYSGKAQSLQGSITTSKENYKGAADKTSSLGTLINQTNETIDGLNQWNEENSIENGGGRICELPIKANNIIINDLSGKINEVQEKANEYNNNFGIIKQ